MRILSATLVVLSFAAATLPAAAEEPVDYLKQIKPLLAGRCFTCHGNLKQESGLRVDTAGAMLEGGEGGAAVVPHKSAESLLIQAVRGLNGITRMPLEGTPLSEEEIALLAAWIDAGAIAPPETPLADPRRHWSFQPPQRPAVPQVANAVWARNPVDAFLAAEHERLGLVPQSEAPRHVLLRRIYLDLVGVPPTRDELHAFLADGSADAYERVIDRLLASPQYGQRWGRHWMDVWRYADWAGYGQEIRDSQRHIWRWRDWIIESLNEDKPYNQMVVEMLAADEVASGDPAALRATGFLARNWYKFNRNVWLENTVEHTSKAFLGLTLNCAKCHDHMYDPISQRDYYQFRAFFEPYDVRTDRLPGQADLMQDGLARVFDAKPEAPTFLFFRGDEKQPDQEHPLGPALPELLAPNPPAIAAVALPAEASYPALKPFIQQEMLAAAAAEAQQRRAALEPARQAVTLAQDRLASIAAAADAPNPTTDPVATPPMLADDFSAPRPDLWTIGAGQWEHKEGRLVQSLVGSVECRLASLTDHPADFSATFRFKITGVEQWRSVGLSFDLQESGDFDAVYVSAYAGGPKLQIYHQRGGAATYPADGWVTYDPGLNKEHLLRVDARGGLLNVSVDGELLLAYRLPHDRRPGKFAVWTFDASAEFLEARVEALPSDIQLVESAGGDAAPMPAATVEAAQAAVSAAEAAVAFATSQLAAAEAQAASVAARIAGDNARHAVPPAADADLLAAAAGKAEAAATLTRAKADQLAVAGEVAAARLALNEADEKTKQALAAAETKATEAAAKVTAAEAAAANPPATYSPLDAVYPSTSSGRRSALARWIADRGNPLTARVAVNHVWMRHYGEPLVPTVFDFGLNGKPPMHPALLDWLAVELMESGWSMKALHRLLVTSTAYRMASTSASGGEANLALDRDNLFLWRMRTRRAEAEVVRDSLLSVSGQLDSTLGGPDLDQETGLTSTRRSVYFRHAADKQMTFLLLFDAAGVTECYRRNQSVVPQQALALANSPISLSQARLLSQRLSGEIGADASPENSGAFITAAFEHVLTRPPTAEEVAQCQAFLVDQAGRLAATADLAAFNTGAASPIPPAAEPHLRARENLVHVLMNHNDFVTIR